jgi:hypothetical protein
MAGKIGSIVLLVVLFTTQCYGAQAEKRVVAPIENADDIRPMQTVVWEELYDLSEYDQRFCQALYLWGFFDALALYALECPSIQGLLSHYEEMNFNQIADTINAFYDDHPSQRNFAPAFVTSIIIPELKERLPSLLEEYER